MSRQQQVDRQILRIALPAIGENFLQMLMGMVDSYLVAQLGLVAVSGVSVAGNIITIYQAIFIALGAAVVSLLSKSMGQKDQKAIARQATESIKVTVLLSCILGVLSLCFGKELIALLGVEVAVAEAGGIYLSLVDQCFECSIIEHLDLCFWAGHRRGCLRNGSLSLIRGFLALASGSTSLCSFSLGLGSRLALPCFACCW